MDAHTSFAYVTNKMDRFPLSESRPLRVLRPIWQALGFKLVS